jgi:hypothetical protein
MAVGLVSACQFREQLPAELRLAVEKNCAFALQCRSESGRHVIEVIRLQEPNAPDASTLLTALPPPTVTQLEQRASVRQQSRAALSRPRGVVEAAIAAHMQPEPVQATMATIERSVITVVMNEPASTPTDADAEPPNPPQLPRNGRSGLDRYEPL